MAKDTFIDQTKEVLGERYQKTREKVDDLIGEARKNWSGVSERVDEEWQDVSREVVKYVKSNPTLSLAIAGAVGFVLGLLIGRRDD